MSQARSDVTAAPVYLETYTDEDTFWNENGIPRS